MGYNTAILILNDGLDQLEKHPEQFVKNLSRQINKGTEDSISVGNHCNPVQVMKTEHADIFRLYASQCNSMVELSQFNNELIKDCEAREYYKNHVLNLIEQAEDELRQLKGLIQKRIK